MAMQPAGPLQHKSTGATSEIITSKSRSSDCSTTWVATSTRLFRSAGPPSLPNRVRTASSICLSPAKGEPGVEQLDHDAVRLQGVPQLEVRFLCQPDRVPNDGGTSAVRQRLP